MLVTLIHNPNAGDQDESGKSLRKLLEGAGYEVRYRSAKEDGWKQALKKDADLDCLRQRADFKAFVAGLAPKKDK